MNDSEIFLGLAAFGKVFLSAGLMLALTVLRAKTKPSFRNIDAFNRLRNAIGHLVEDGSRLHVSRGRGGLITPQGGAALAGLSLLRQLAVLTSAGDRTPIATSGDGALAILSQTTLQGAAERSSQAGNDLSMGRLTGLTPFSYAAGAIPSIRDEHVSANVLIGNFGMEAALLTEAAERTDSFSLAASDNPTAQAVLYATARETLIGEEIFAAGAYSGSGPLHTASLTVQDILRWIAIVVMLGGAVLKMAGII